MDKDSLVKLMMRVEEGSRPSLDEVLRQGARRMLQAAVEAEVADYVERHAALADPRTGRRLVVRNGHQPERGNYHGEGATQAECQWPIRMQRWSTGCSRASTHWAHIADGFPDSTVDNIDTSHAAFSPDGVARAAARQRVVPFLGGPGAHSHALLP